MDATDIALEVAFLAPLYADYRQTRRIAEQPELYYETNPILGKHPSKDLVLGYFVGAAITHYLIAEALPGKWRTGFQITTTLIEARQVQVNLQIGLRF